MTPAVTARRLQLRDVAILPTRDTHLPMPSMATLLPGTSLRPVNLNSTFRLCSRNLIPDLPPILLRRRTNEVVTTMTAVHHTGKRRIARIPTMPTTADNLLLQDLHRQMAIQATVTFLPAFMNTPQSDMAVRLL